MSVLINRRCLFNSDPSKQAFRRLIPVNVPALFFNNLLGQRVSKTVGNRFFKITAERTLCSNHQLRILTLTTFSLRSMVSNGFRSNVSNIPVAFLKDTQYICISEIVAKVRFLHHQVQFVMGFSLA